MYQVSFFYNLGHLNPNWDKDRPESDVLFVPLYLCISYIFLGRSSICTLDSSFTTSCYAPTLCGLICFGLGQVLLTSLLQNHPLLHGIIQFCLFYLCWEWMDLYGSRLTRKERVFFDEKNILETSTAFDFLLGPVLDDTTPGGSGGDACCGKYPTAGLLKSLIADPKQAEMQNVSFFQFLIPFKSTEIHGFQFYKQHYGNMYNIALRANQEAKAAESGVQPTSSSASSNNSLQNVKSTASVASSDSGAELSVSPSAAKTNESQQSRNKNSKK